jgi:hypothetical protein
MAEVISLFSDDVAEIVELRQLEDWLCSPTFPQQPPAEIATILSQMPEALSAPPSAQSSGPQLARESRTVIPFRRKPPAA